MTIGPQSATDSRANLPSKKLAESQSVWLEGARSRLLRRAGISKRRRILDLGSGWGQVSEELKRRSGAEVFSVDLEPVPTEVDTDRVRADGHFLPFKNDRFDLVFCQTVLMWGSDPRAVLAEAVRVLRPGGALAMIEPDYGGMMEYPEQVSVKSIWIDSLRRAGADPLVGRKLPSWCEQMGLEVEVFFFERLFPPDDQRFELLLELPLTKKEKKQVANARAAPNDPSDTPVVHLPFWMVYAEL